LQNNTDIYGIKMEMQLVINMPELKQYIHNH